MTSASHPAQRSLRWKILSPLVIASAVVAALIIWLLHRSSDRRVRSDLSHRAELVANMISYSSESISHTGQLQRIVAAVGADRDVMDIVVMAGEPVRIIGSTKALWLNKALAEIPDAQLAADLARVVRERKPVEHFLHGENTFTLMVPLQLTHQTIVSGAPANGAVMVRLDTRPLTAEIRRSTLSLVGVFLLGLFVFFAVSFMLLERRVLRPVTAINARIEADGGLADIPEDSIDPSDELGRLASTLLEYRERTESAMRELENQKFALDQHAIVSITNTRGNILYANDRFCAISGYSRDELHGKNHRILKSGRHPESFYSDMWKTITSGKTWHGEICNRNKSGELYWVSSSIVPLPGADGKPEAYISIRTDITARKQVEEQLQTAKEAADAANKAKSDFLATMSHEIRTPLNGVIGFTDLLLGTSLNEEQRHHVELLRTSGENLLLLINDILDLSKIEAGKLLLEKAPVDFRRCIHDSIELMADQAGKKNLRIEAEIAADIPVWIIGDAMRLRQILLNLIGNAIKFTATGGVRVEVARDGDVLKILIVDTGVGMSAEQQGRIFQKFSQADTSTTRRYGGTGLGLVICKSLVEAMGGNIGVRSAEGVGSTFWIQLPIVIPTAGGAHAGSTAQAAAPGQAEVNAPATEDALVLVVDDNKVNLTVAGSMLKALGYRVETAVNGQEAVEMTMRQAYAAVLMDYHMPVLDGVDATRKIRSGTGPNHDKPIIGISASLDDRDVCLAAGMNQFLPKPFRKTDLEQVLQEVFRS